MRNASVGTDPSPGEATDADRGTGGKDRHWAHIITVWDSKGKRQESRTLWNALFKPDHANVPGQGRVHKILIKPQVWMSDGRGNFKFYQDDLYGKRLFSWHTMKPAACGARSGSVWTRTTISNIPGSGRIDGLLRASTCQCAM